MDDGKPSFWYFQMVGVTILLIGGSISGIILVIGLEQEGSWVIFKVGGMLLCLTFILSNIAQIRYLSRLKLIGKLKITNQIFMQNLG